MRRYFTLVASLPHLVHFERAERLPINRSRLDSRLTMLDEAHARDLASAEALVLWQRLARTLSTEHMARRYRDTMAVIGSEPLREFVGFRMDQRTVLAALRLRHRGEAAPASAAALGVGPNRDRVVAHWDDDDLGVAGMHPWVAQARACLEHTHPVELERLQMDVIWRWLTRVGDTNPFGFEGVFAFVFKWDITHRWLAHDPQAATARFKELVTEAISEQQHLYG